METVFDCAECLGGGEVDWILLVILFLMPVVVWFLPDDEFEGDEFTDE